MTKVEFRKFDDVAVDVAVDAGHYFKVAVHTFRSIAYVGNVAKIEDGDWVYFPDSGFCRGWVLDAICEKLRALNSER
jgi:hypothetical protein